MRIAQADLPDSLTPYADIADAAGCDEAEVIALLERLRASGVIRRFGASLRHQNAGWNCNAMVAWRATREQADLSGRIVAQNKNVSHAYYRPSAASDWPYTFYTMVHGRSEEECQETVAALAESLPLDDYMVLRTLRELKKTSMTYFRGENCNG